MYSNAETEFVDNGDMQMMPEGVPDEMIAAAAAGGRKKGAAQNNALTPITIASLIAAQHDQLTKQFMHGAKPLQHVEFVGVPVQVIPSPSSRSVTLVIDDGSGKIEVAKVLNEIGGEEEAQMYEKAASGKKNGAYLRVFGKLIEYRSNVFSSATRQVTAHLIQKVEDANVLTWMWARAICQKVEADMTTTRAQWEQSNSSASQPQQQSQQSSYGQSQSASQPRAMQQPHQQQQQPQPPQQYGGYMQQPQQQMYQQQAAPQQFMNMPQQQQRGAQQFMQQPQMHMPMQSQASQRPMQAPQQSAYHLAQSGQMAQQRASMQADRMLEFFRTQSQLPQWDSGIPIDFMAQKFNMSMVETSAWIAQLSSRGLAYSTLDDQHWKCQRNRTVRSDRTTRSELNRLVMLCCHCSIGLKGPRTNEQQDQSNQNASTPNLFEFSKP